MDGVIWRFYWAVRFVLLDLVGKKKMEKNSKERGEMGEKVRVLCNEIVIEGRQGRKGKIRGVYSSAIHIIRATL